MNMWDIIEIKYKAPPIIVVLFLFTRDPYLSAWLLELDQEELATYLDPEAVTPIVQHLTEKMVDLKNLEEWEKSPCQAIEKLINSLSCEDQERWNRMIESLSERYSASQEVNINGASTSASTEQLKDPYDASTSTKQVPKLDGETITSRIKIKNWLWQKQDEIHKLPLKEPYIDNLEGSANNKNGSSLTNELLYEPIADAYDDSSINP